MAFEKYIKKNGKIYGPYVYHNRKENGKVITTYLGKSKPKKNYTQIIFLGAFFLFISLSLFFVVKIDLTGKVSLSLEESYEFGEQITGRVKLNLVSGELIPLSTKLIVDNAGEINEFLLSDLISHDISEGNFYVENVEISGTGNGYGVLGEKIIYPNVSFVLNILPKGLVNKSEKPEKPEEIIEEEAEQEMISPGDDFGEPNETEELIEEQNITLEKEPAEEIIEKTEIQEPEVESETAPDQVGLEEGASSDTEGKEKEEKVKEEKVKEKEQEKVEEPEPAPEPEPETSPLTGGVVSEAISEIEGIVSRKNPFSYEIPNGKSAEIKSSSQDIELSIVDDTAVVTTEYSETEKGFGEDYLTEEISEILIDLNQLNLTAFQEGDLIITLIYDDIEIVSVSETINIEGKELEIPVIEQNLTEINVTIQNQTIENETIITITNITQGEINLTTIQYGAVLNKPVKWKKNIKLTQPSSNLSIEVPIQAENISVYIISSSEESEIENKTEIEKEQEIIEEPEPEAINETTEQEAINETEEIINETIEQEIIPENKTETINETEEELIKPETQEQEKIFANNISNQSTSNSEEQINKPEKQKIKITAEVVSGEVSAEIDLKEKSIFSDFFRKVFGFMTGRTIDVEEIKETKEVFIDLDTLSGYENLSRGATEFEIEYETPAPYAIELNISNGKKITIASEIYYENILAYTLVEGEVKINSDNLKLYWYASYEDALAYNAALVQNITENITTQEQNITPEQEINESIINESVFDENITSEQNTTSGESDEIYSSILTGNVIENESQENITEIINETIIISENITEIVNETLDEIIETNISVIENYSGKIKIQVPYTAYDLDSDGYVDYVEWMVPHLSNQTYELVIEIIKAEHLDENRSFISDIYDYVKVKDDNWSEIINDSEYVRVTFEVPLDNTRDITIYARSVCAVSGNSFVIINDTQVSCDIYQKKKRIEEIRRLLNE